jgi:DNA repair exonuclease SbcCD nuclease subunit
LRGLRAVVDATIEAAADALLIAGDLFDHARVKNEHAEQALEQLARLRVPVIVGNGNHDCLQPPSIYERVCLADAGSHVCFLDDPDGSRATVSGLRLTVWARAMLEHHPGFDPLLGYQRLDDGTWQVALAHGHYFATGHRPDRSSPLLQQQIGALGCDYLALGHWHRYLDVSHNGTPAFYCGSPSEAGGRFAGANLVTLDPRQGVSVERIALEP